MFAKLPKSLTTVTTFSKLLAMVLFILFPFLGFYIGTRYQQEIDEPSIHKAETVRIVEKRVEVTPFPTPTPVSFTNWKLYRNTKFNYQILYNNSVKETVISADNPYRGLLAATSLNYTKPYSVTVWKNYNIPINDIASFRVWCKKSFDDVSEVTSIGGTECPSHAKDLTLNLTTVDGVQAYEFPDWGIKTVYIPHSSYVYGIFFNGNQGYYDANEIAQDKKTADYVISTFKFLD